MCDDVARMVYCGNCQGLFDRINTIATLTIQDKTLRFCSIKCAEKYFNVKMDLMSGRRSGRRCTLVKKTTKR